METEDLDAEIGSASAAAYRRLERLIVTLELAPSAMTTEAALIERIGLGRTPVREAIQRLAWEGLIVVRPRAGLAIAPLVPGDWLKVLDARRGAEVVLAKAAARNSRDEARFAAIEQQMKDARSEGDADLFLVADKALDDAINEAAGNLYASRVVAPLQSHSRRFWFRYRTWNSLPRSAALHIDIIRAIRANEVRSAAKAMEQLIDMLKDAAKIAARAQK